MRKVFAADLFCGAGGSSTGLTQACAASGRSLELSAVNHWARAVETHAANHPKAIHACEDLTTMDPRKVVPGGKLDLLVASPECTHHSVARGGKPVSDQSRASAWCVLRWATALRIDRILIENVREFESWGPIGSNNKPLKSKRGETFQAFISGLRSLGYKVDWKVLNAADYGDATTRERLFIQAVRGRRQIRWPEPTHGKRSGVNLFGSRQPWKPARDVIDLGMRGHSIFRRKRPLSDNTLKRIEAGLIKFGGANAEPFLVLLRGTERSQIDNSARRTDDPIPTITASGAHVGLCEPFVMACTHHGGDRVYSADGPLPTITTAKRGEHALIEPFIIPQFSEHSPRSVDRPLGTITTTSRGVGLCEPFILPPEGIHRGGGCLVEPFIATVANSGDDKYRCRSVGEPVPTITAGGGRFGLVEPFLVTYYGTGEADATTEPLRTITTKDRLGLVEPARLDILFRMLQPRELAAAMSFPADYRFAGNRAEVVKQIGNAVPVGVARALCAAMLEDCT